MLHKVLEEIEKVNGPITLNELSRRLNIDPSALQGMIEYWVRKGRLRDDDEMPNAVTACGSESCTSAEVCGGSTTSCAFVAKMPKSYSIPLNKVK